jgi:hypothetical protein
MVNGNKNLETPFLSTDSTLSRFYSTGSSAFQALNEYLIVKLIDE